MTQLIDLSHTIEDGLITYKELPAPIICDYLSREASKAHYADGTTFQIGKIEMCSNTGTYDVLGPSMSHYKQNARINSR